MMNKTLDLAWFFFIFRKKIPSNKELHVKKHLQKIAVNYFTPCLKTSSI